MNMILNSATFPIPAICIQSNDDDITPCLRVDETTTIPCTTI